jgi:hypothetical protein
MAMPDSARDLERRQRFDAWLDAGMGCCALLTFDGLVIVR